MHPPRQIGMRLDFQPVGQPPCPVFGGAGNQQRQLARMLAGFDHAAHPPGRHDPVVDPAQRDDGTALERDRLDRIFEPLGQPWRVPVEKRPCFAPAAMPRQYQQRLAAMRQRQAVIAGAGRNLDGDRDALAVDFHLGCVGHALGEQGKHGCNARTERRSRQYPASQKSRAARAGGG